MIQINELDPQEQFVPYQKCKPSDVPVDTRILQDLENFLNENKEAFAEDERQIDTKPLFKMSIDTSDHKPIVKIKYELSTKCQDWVGQQLDKLLEDGVSYYHSFRFKS